MSIRSGLSGLATLHDWITRLGFALAGVCLAVIVISYTYEVGARYIFSAPTDWAASLVSYMLCCMVFLAMPELSRERVHIFISIFLDLMSNARAAQLQRIAYVVAGVACFFAAAFCADAALQQFERGVSTINEWRIPKWWLSATISYGLLSTGIYYFRYFVTGVTYQTSDQASEAL